MIVLVVIDTRAIGRDRIGNAEDLVLHLTTAAAAAAAIRLMRKNVADDAKKSKKSKKSKSMRIGDEWGKYGIIYESDIFTKEAEFQAWLIEVKRVDVETLSNNKRKDMFNDFMEDYNTATMPHEKFYNLSKWEQRQHALRMGETLPPEDFNFKNDEEQLRTPAFIPLVFRLQHKQAARAAASRQPMLQMSAEQIEELTKVNRERVQAERMRRLGLTPKEGMGVRYEYEEI
ncbi:hypothetical protein DFQ28_006939 [Apophysomyces sp. BC1034]|nr:hypothetical protein DFQ28_006939 [Apophysomyces sp. BC1034]